MLELVILVAVIALILIMWVSIKPGPAEQHREEPGGADQNQAATGDKPEN